MRIIGIASSVQRWISNHISGANIKGGNAGDASCEELWNLVADLQLRELAFWICANLMGSLLTQCEFKTFVAGKEVKEREYYTWNIQPNVNQNAAIFRHKLVAMLYQHNKALVVDPGAGRGWSEVVVADSWKVKKEWVRYPNTYDGVSVGDFSFNKTFQEEDVLHLQLFHKNMKPVTDAIYTSYARLIAASMKNFEWNSGKHFKVHVNGMASGKEEWAEELQKIMNAQVKPFFDANSAVLPEMDGYDYTDLSKNYTTQQSTRDIRSLFDDIFDFTARGFLISPGLFTATADGKKEMLTETLTYALDPLCNQLEQEITRKRYGYDRWRKGEYIKIDTSTVRHFDVFENAGNIEKLVSSGGFSINAVRRAAGQPEIDEPWANTHFITKNFAPVLAVLKALEGGE